ncbi:MAG: hypothetical protein P4L84_13215 [Isosphaeraceae bacterium]|nr:hypothetical protein [Isosphaeraceae bacterium]
MRNRSQRRRQFQFESLERRETPSAGVSGAVQSLARSAHAKTAEIHMSGNGTVSGSTVTLTSGQSSQLGPITGTVTGTNAVVTGSKGSLTLTSVTGTFGKEHNGKESFHGTFTIVSGSVGGTAVTGGQGTFSGSLNVTANTLHITFKGKVTE